jgi:hypothetical protein
MNRISLYDPIKIARKLKKGTYSEKEVKAIFKQVVPIYSFNMKQAEKEIVYLIKFIVKSFKYTEYMTQMLSQHVQFRLVEGGAIYSLDVIKFTYLFILLAPLADKKITLKEGMIPKDTKFTVSNNIDNFIDAFYIDSNKHLFTFNEACEHIEFVRIWYDELCEAIGERLMISISMFDFTDLMRKDEDAKRIIMVEDAKELDKLTPNELEKRAMQDTDKVIGITKKFPSTNLAETIDTYSKTQTKEFMVHLTHKPMLNGSTLPLVDHTNNIKGFTSNTAFVIDSTGM